MSKRVCGGVVPSESWRTLQGERRVPFDVVGAVVLDSRGVVHHPPQRVLGNGVVGTPGHCGKV
jgi:hypothetical protein